MVALSTIAVILTAILFDLLITRISYYLNVRRRNRLIIESGDASIPLSTSRLDIMVAPGAFHYKGHTWLQWKMDGSMVVGMNDLLHRVIGKLDEIRLPQPGHKLLRGEKSVMLRQGDKVLYLLSPASGIVTKVNEDVINNPSISKNDPYNAGWLYIMSPGDADQDMAFLMVARRAEEWMSREKERMRNYFIDMLHKGNGKKGSAPKGLDGIMEGMDDETWVMFKDHFIYHKEWRG